MNSRLNGARLTDALERYIRARKKITARSIARELGVHASTITRDIKRKSLLDRYILQQSENNKNKESRSVLLAQIARQAETIAQLEHRIQLLLAAHKAMIIAIGSYGGAEAWRRFFKDYELVTAEVDELVREAARQMPRDDNNVHNPACELPDRVPHTGNPSSAQPESWPPSA